MDEKQGITVDDLFRVRTSIEVEGKSFYIRALSELEVQARNNYAAMQRAKLRRALQDNQSADYLSMVDWLDGAEDEQLRSVILFQLSGVYAREAAETIQPEIIPIPDGADAAEQDEVAGSRKNELERVNTARQKQVDDRLAALNKELEAQPNEVLLKRARKSVVESNLFNRWVFAFESYTLHCAVYTDPQYAKPLFLTPESSGEFTGKARQTLLNQYVGEMNRLSTLDLKYFLSTAPSADTLKPSSGAVATVMSPA